MTNVSFVRRVQVEIGYERLIHALTTGTEFHARIVKGLPDGARLVRVDAHHVHEGSFIDPADSARLIFEHPSFEPTAPGQALPELRIAVEHVDCGSAHEERTALREPATCSACREPAYITSQDFVSWPTATEGIFAYLAAGRPRHGCARHPPRKELVLEFSSRHEAEALLARPLALSARIVDAARQRERG